MAAVLKPRRVDGPPRAIRDPTPPLGCGPRRPSPTPEDATPWPSGTWPWWPRSVSVAMDNFFPGHTVARGSRYVRLAPGGG
jgi:hypothetical protein